MTAALAVTPGTQAVNGYVTVTGTGGGDYKNRLKLDGVIVYTVCHAPTFSTSIQVGSVAATQTFTWEQRIAGTWTSADTETVVVTSSSGGSVTPFPGGGPATGAALAARMSDSSVRIIEIAAGTYTDAAGFHVLLKSLPRGAANSLLVRPAAGAAVNFSGSGGGTGQTAVFGFGPEWGPGMPYAVTDYITIDAAGTGGSFGFINYAIGSFGLVDTGWADHITVNGINVSACSGDASQTLSHCVYRNQANGQAGSNLTANGWNVVGDAARTLNGIQTFHEPQGAGFTAHTWTVDKLHTWALIGGQSGSGVDIDGWQGTNCDRTIYSPAVYTISGTVKNCNGHGSCGPLALGSDQWLNTNLANGGGNTA